ncbi:MAG TPA: tetratricopeptide repeat protein [Candidatus Acidoferrales bacterium]|nr:tetratricopeptide repeat protein [Candidatus Acidoferrales bacterium]
MNPGPENHTVYRFGVFEANSQTGEFLRKGVRVKLQEQPFRLLQLLLENAGEIVSRESVRQRLWPGNTFVEFDASLGVAVGKLREALGDDADNPRFIETIPRRGYRFIAPVKVATAHVSASSTATAAGPTVFASPSRLYATKHGLIIATLVLLLLGTAFYVLHARRGAGRSTAHAETSIPRVHVRRSVAVLGFRNLPGRPEDNWLSSAVCEMLNTELAAGGELRMVPGEDVAQAKSELPLRDEDSLGKSTLQRLRINPGADLVVVGSYTMIPADPKRRIRIDVRLQDTARGATIAEDSVSGDENDLFNMVSDLGGKLRQSLGVAALSEGIENAARAALPSNEKAARLYAEGRARLWAFDYFAARDLLNKAIAADPYFPLSHAALSDVWWHTGYDAKARVEARRALELSNHLSQEQRLLVEGQYQRTVEEWPKAVETYRSLFRLFPDNLDYGLLFASTQMHLSAADSLQTLALLRQLPPPLGDDARIDMTEASAWINRDFNKARSAANLAIEKATAQGSPVIVSRTYGILCQQEPSIGASTEAINICQSALEAGIATKDPNGEAMMRTDLAVLHYLRGDLAESAQMFQQAVKKFRQVGNRDGVATALSNFADICLSQGNLMEAKKLLEESIPEYQAVDDKEGVALNLDSLGDIWRQNGELDKAETAYRKAEVIARQIEDKDATAYVLNGLGDLALDRGDLASAGKSYEEAVGLRNQAGEKQAATESRVSLAKLAIEEGHASDAETSARECKEQFHREQQADDELGASIVLIDALLTQGKQSEAQKEMGAAQQLGNVTQNRFLRLQFELASGRVFLASDLPDASRPFFQRVADDARHYGFVGLELSDELAMAELANKTKHAAQAQTELHALQKSAASKGLGLIARKARREALAFGNQIGTP